jgi:hypothetical protein
MLEDKIREAPFFKVQSDKIIVWIVLIYDVTYSTYFKQTVLHASSDGLAHIPATVKLTKSWVLWNCLFWFKNMYSFRTGVVFNSISNVSSLNHFIFIANGSNEGFSSQIQTFQGFTVGFLRSAFPGFISPDDLKKPTVNPEKSEGFISPDKFYFPGDRGLKHCRVLSLKPMCFRPANTHCIVLDSKRQFFCEHCKYLSICAMMILINLCQFKLTI